MNELKTYNVNIYYNEEEVHDAFKDLYNDVKQSAKVHIFTKNSLPFSFYGEDNNVELHSAGSLWDRLKSWVTGEEQFQQQFSMLNISTEDRVRYRSIIQNGGTIIVSTEDESINNLFTDPETTKLIATNAELNVHADPDLAKPSEIEDEKVQASSANNHSYKDVSPTKETSIADANQDYEDREKNFMEKSENIDALSDHHELSHSTEAITNRESFPRVPEEAMEHEGDMMSHLDAYEAQKENMPENSGSGESVTEDHGEQLSPDDTISTYDVVSNRNQPESDEQLNSYPFNVPTDGVPNDFEFSGEQIADENNHDNSFEGDSLSSEQSINGLNEEIIENASEQHRHDNI